MRVEGVSPDNEPHGKASRNFGFPTQRSHILKIKIDSFVSKDIFYMYYCKYYRPIMLVAFDSNEKPLHSINIISLHT